MTSPDETVPEARRSEAVVATAARAYAAIDLGTNNCRLLVGAPTGNGFRVLDSLSRTVRLGEGLDESGMLGAAAMDRAIAALHGCVHRLGRRRVSGLRAVATEACRRAGNGAAFLARARGETGLPLEVISAREEAELALESCAPLLRGAARRALLFDIGGGSTEIAWVRMGQEAPQLIGTISLPLGVVTLAERWPGAADTAEGFGAMAEEVARQLQPFEAVHRIAQEVRQGGVVLLGTSGTVTTLAGIALDLPRYTRAAVDGTVLSCGAAMAALGVLRDMGRAGLARHPCVGPERAEFVLPGCAVFAAIQGLWPAPQVVVADRGLREGMLLRLMRAPRRTGRGPGGWTKPARPRPDAPGAGLAGLPQPA